MLFTQLNTAQEAAFLQLLAAWQAQQIPTLQSIDAMLLTNQANWKAPFPAPIMALSISGEITVSRQAKLSAYRIAPVGHPLSPYEGNWTSLVEGPIPFEDGDVVMFWHVEQKRIKFNLLGQSGILDTSGDFIAFIKTNGQFKCYQRFPVGNLWPWSGNPMEYQFLDTDDTLTPFTSFAVVTAKGAATPASAIYEITASAIGGILGIYVEGNQISVATGANPTSIDLLGADIVTNQIVGSGYTITYNSGTNELTITDNLNRGTIVNAFLLSSYETGGVAGTTTGLFSGGMNGAEAAVTFTEVLNPEDGRVLVVKNNNATESITFDKTGSSTLEGVSPVVVLAGDYAQLAAWNGKWAVK